jgi:L-rhamnose-H+ transport protein
MLGGFTSNLVWCVYLHIRNGSGREYFSATAPVLLNIIFSAIAGVTWYLQFFFYGMGTVKLGEKYDFSSWTLHMAFIIVFSNLWALIFREWTAASKSTRSLIAAGIAVLMLSTIIIGYGNKIGEAEPAKKEVAEAVAAS